MAAEEALALQRQEAQDRRDAEVEAARPRVDLRVEYVRGNRYRIVNHGQASAENLTFVDPPALARGLTEVINLAGNEGHYFNVVGASGVPVPTFLKAVWDGQTEPVTVRMPPV
ncbi:hypothetical protein [Streptomyces sp. NPDC056785]|uniref:hypothetical protein n=1 Tax=Streptomyces sp. NPDC056785 TaxID=3345944 RepID=UPI0036BB0CE2